MEKSYTVRARMVVDPPRMEEAKKRVKETGREVEQTAGRMKGGLRESLTSGFAPIARGGVVYLAVREVFGLVNRIASTFGSMSRAVARIGGELEQTQLALAQTLAAAFDTSFEEAERSGEAMFRRLREQARDMSVGGLSDVIQVTRDIAGAGARAGLTAADVERLSFGATTIGMAQGFDAGGIGSRLIQALEGQVGASRDHVIMRALGGREQVQAFNEIEDAGERAKILMEALGDASAVLSTASSTWDSAWGTTQDILAELGEELTALAFSELKGSVETLNEALGSGGLTTAAYGLGTVVTALMQPFHWVASGASAVAEVFEVLPGWGEYLVATFGELGEDVASLGGTVGSLLVTMGTGLLPVVTVLGTLLTIVTKSLRVFVTTITYLLDILWQSIKWVASWLTDSVQADFGGAADRFTAELGDIFTLERQQRERAAEEEREAEARDRQRARDQAKPIEVRVAADIEWRDNDSVAVTIAGAVQQALEQYADRARESMYALRSV